MSLKRKKNVINFKTTNLAALMEMKKVALDKIAQIFTKDK
jgi:hypothetical protein